MNLSEIGCYPKFIRETALFAETATPLQIDFKPQWAMFTSMPVLDPMLKQLRLSGILDSLEIRTHQAIDDKLSYTDFLALLLQDETCSQNQ